MEGSGRDGWNGLGWIRMGWDGWMNEGEGKKEGKKERKKLRFRRQRRRLALGFRRIEDDG